MWNHSEVCKEWTKSKEEKGKVRLSQDSEKRPYLSRDEMKAVAEIIVSKYFSTKRIRIPLVGVTVSMRFVNGIGKHVGILRLDYSTASRERNNQFIVQAYIKSPDHVDIDASSCPLWLKFEQVLSYYEESKSDP